MKSAVDAPSIAFGTSGLRGPEQGFTLERIHAYVEAFLWLVRDSTGNRDVYLGADLRSSSPRIATQVCDTIKNCGWRIVYAGNVPTPALAAYALARRAPAIMVTGSHIPETHNGLKFYRQIGELRKSDELPIIERVQSLQAALKLSENSLPLPDPAIKRDYAARYFDAFEQDALAGLKVGIYQHSSVGRDLLVDILEGLGAECIPFARAKHFVAIDTEAFASVDLETAKRFIDNDNLDAVVSTDGDGDRPLVIDETGTQINGDVLGAFTARLLGIKTIVTPITSTTAIEQSGWFETVLRTRIGSPYVISAMDEAVGASIAGFEANGGFLLGSEISFRSGHLTRLPTRDALLPIISTLLKSAQQRRPLSTLVSDLPTRIVKSDRVRDVAPKVGAHFLRKLYEEEAVRAALDSRLARPNDANTLDGVRFRLTDQSVVHFRQSGNAPEMRCYVETSSADKSEKLLSDMIKSLKTYFADRG